MHADEPGLRLVAGNAERPVVTAEQPGASSLILSALAHTLQPAVAVALTDVRQWHSFIRCLGSLMSLQGVL